MKARTQKILRITSAGAVILLVAAVLFGARLFKTNHSAAAAPAAQNHSEHANMQASGKKILYWYDPMHPKYKSDKPGIAPDCGMQLVPMYEGEGQVEDGMIQVSAQRQQLLGVRTAQVEDKAVSRTLRTSGLVVADETRTAHIHVKTPGWVDQVFVNFVGQFVKRGQPLFTIYSPDLVATQEEYLIAKRGEQSLGKSPYQDVAQNSQTLLDSARQRLQLWDLSNSQIKHLDDSGKVSKTVTFYSPVTGYVTERNAYPQTSVNGDTSLYTVVDLSRVWVMADVYESELPYVKTGQPADVKLSYMPGKSFGGHVTYSYPVLDPQTHTAKVRIDVPNSGLLLKPNMFTDVELHIGYGKHIVVPSDAVLDSGTRQTVFVVHDNGRFEPREVTVGPTVDGETIIEFGLEKGETIVTSGNFLLDSESQLKYSSTDEHQH